MMKSPSSVGLFLGLALVAVSVILKLTGVTAWSWPVTLIPLWAGILVLAGYGAALAVQIEIDVRQRERHRPIRSHAGG